MKKSLLAVFFAASLAVGYAANEVLTFPPKFQETSLPKTCYLEALNFKEALKAQDYVNSVVPRWSKIMRVELVRTTSTGHALLVFKEGEKWKVYDTYHGTFSLEFEDEPTPEQIAAKISKEYQNARWHE